MAETELLTFMGMDRPPTSYGGYGGNDPNELPKYTFQYPQGWNRQAEKEQSERARFTRR